MNIQAQKVILSPLSSFFRIYFHNSHLHPLICWRGLVISFIKLVYLKWQASHLNGKLHYHIKEISKLLWSVWTCYYWGKICSPSGIDKNRINERRWFGRVLNLHYKKCELSDSMTHNVIYSHHWIFWLYHIDKQYCIGQVYPSISF